MKRYDIIVGRESNGKTYWTKIGAAFERDQGGFSLSFDALPIPDAKGCRALMVEPKGADPARQAPQGRGPAMDDEIPFAAEWRL